MPHHLRGSIVSKPTNTNMTSLHAATPLHEVGTSLANLT